MDENSMIEDLIRQLDGGMAKGTGHVNVDVDQTMNVSKSVDTMGCVDCSKNPMACSVPTLLEDTDEE